MLENTNANNMMGFHVTLRLDVAKNFLSHLQPPPSYRTWVRIYHKSWEKTVRFRGESQHSKCRVCEDMKEYKRQASTVSDSNLVAEAYVQHLNLMLADRKADAFWRQIGFDSVKSGVTFLHEGASTWLTMTVDGMDCAKFKVPLNISKSKLFQRMHRPEMKLSLVVPLHETMYFSLFFHSCSPIWVVIKLVTCFHFSA